MPRPSACSIAQLTFPRATCSPAVPSSANDLSKSVLKMKTPPENSNTSFSRSGPVSSMSGSATKTPGAGAPCTGPGRLIDIAYDGSSDTVDGQMRQLMHVVKHPYHYYRFQPSLSEANNALDDTSKWNLEDLKRRAASIFDDPEKLAKIENLCGLLATADGRVEARRTAK